MSQDGETDFTLRDAHRTTNTLVFASLSALPAVGNGVEGLRTLHRIWAYPLKRGARIGSGHPFEIDKVASARIEDSTHYSYGSWLNVGNRYLGLKFYIAGKLHYG